MGENEQLKMAMQAFQDGDFSNAGCLCEAVLAHQPDNVQVLRLSGVVAYQQGNMTLAKKRLNKAVELGGPDAALCNDLGLVYLTENHLPQARVNFEKALAENPRMAEAWNNLGLTLKKMQDTRGAREAFLRAIDMNPGYAKAFFSLGDLHLDLKDVETARGYLKKAIRLSPGYLAARNHLAMCHMETGDFQTAEAELRKACAIAPDSPQTWCNLGNVQRKTYRFKEALISYRKAIALKPDFVEANFNLALVLLLLEDFKPGWSAYEWRLKMLPAGNGYPRRYNLPIWRDEDLTGKSILVYDEQGFGDSFMFCRYLPALKHMGASVVFEVRPGLHTLYRVQRFADQVFPRDSQTLDARQCDYCVPLCSLAHRFFHRGASFQPDIPYIQAPPEKAGKWAQRFPPHQFNIGIVWSGSRVDTSRRCPPQLYKTLLLSDRVTLYSLQKNDRSEMAGTIPWVIHLGPELADFGDTATVLNHLDVVVTIDTAVAHLAGAMGRPTFLLLPYVPDWRWFLGRPQSPWYPTVKLYRQDASRQWSTPMDRVVHDLQKLVERHRQGNGGKQPGPVSAAAADYYEKGAALQNRGDYSAAAAQYRRAIELKSHFTQAYYNTGVCAYLQNDLTTAILNFNEALKCDDRFSSAAFNLGLALEATGEDIQAMAAYRHAIASDPDHFQSHYSLGCLLLKVGQYEEAAAALATASSLDAASWAAVNNLGLAWHHLGRLDKARQFFEAALALKPDSLVTLQNLGNLYMDLDDHQKMLQCYEAALLLQPKDVPSLIDMGKLHQEHLNLDRADHFFKQALSIDDTLVDAHIAIGADHLLRGEFRQGWAEMEWRLRSPKRHLTIYPFDHGKPKWDGANFSDKTLLVHAEQGFGDTIQFARFLPRVKAMGGQVVFQVQPALVRLLSNLAGADRVCSIEASPNASYDFDFYAPLMSIPYLLDLDQNHLPCQSPYLQADTRLVEKWKGRLGKKGVNIGLVWSGSPVHPRTKKRNIPPGQLCVLGSLKGINWYSLQKDPSPESMRMLQNALGITDWTEDFNDFADTAGAIAALDLVISADTGVAHLSGALGKPVRVLLPYFPDWRWMMARKDTPWYPAMTLFRQALPGDWASAMGELLSDLKVTLCK